MHYVIFKKISPQILGAICSSRFWPINLTKQSKFGRYFKPCHLHISPTPHMARDPNITFILWFNRIQTPFGKIWPPVLTHYTSQNKENLCDMWNHCTFTSPQPLMWRMTQKQHLYLDLSGDRPVLGRFEPFWLPFLTHYTPQMKVNLDDMSNHVIFSSSLPLVWPVTQK